MSRPTVIEINPDDPASVRRALETEWLLTNGLGGYAMGTLLGVNTRRYHGLLVAATKPPVGRIVALHSMIEQLVIPRDDGTEEIIDLSTQMFVGGDGEPMLHPEGWRLTSSFERIGLDMVVWMTQVGDTTFVKSAQLMESYSRIALTYSVVNGPPGCRLRLRPLIPLRDFHTLSDGAPASVDVEQDHVIVERGPLALRIRRLGQSRFREDEQTWRNFGYAMDRQRGQDWTENLWSPGVIDVDHRTRDGFDLLIECGPSGMYRWRSTKDRFARRSDAVRALATVGQDFVIHRSVSRAVHNSIIAGYPWFSDWGRDTMIALPGLMLSTGRVDEARSCLELFAQHMRNGLVPNFFDDSGAGIHYNTVDASLWFVHAAHAHWKSTQSPSPSGRGVRGEGISVKRAGKFVLDPELLAFARKLRKEQTDAERLMWGLLRDRRLLGMKFRRQQPIERYVVDFYCAEARLAIELDGGQHNEPSARAKDVERTKLLESRGVHVLRFWNHDVLQRTEAVLEAIVNALTPDPSPIGRGELLEACRAIIAAYRDGTDFNIHMDRDDGLIIAGDHTTQLTWMDAKRDGVVFTPRHGKAVEINALWINALGCMEEMTDDERERDELRMLRRQAAASFRKQFWWAERGCLHDVLTPMNGEDASDAGRFAPDGKLRPNQIFAASLPFSALDDAQKRSVVKVVGERLLTPFGLRTLDRDDPDYRGRFEGNLFERDRAYHNGTVWPWLIGAYCEAILRNESFSASAKRRVRGIIQPLIDEMSNLEGGRCLGQIAEVYDGDPPHRPGGCPAQAWSVAEVLRVLTMIEP